MMAWRGFITESREYTGRRGWDFWSKLPWVACKFYWFGFRFGVQTAYFKARRLFWTILKS
jgi:hypothetical protein